MYLHYRQQDAVCGFLVSPEWIFNLVQGGKITYGNAKLELVRCGKGLTRRLLDLDKWHACQQQQALQSIVLSRSRQLRSGLRAFRQVPQVDAWLHRYSTGVHARKKCWC